MGRDGGDPVQQPDALYISIHAPAWGATPPRCRRDHPSLYFNPRARVGRDSANVQDRDGNYNFNPRARVGRDRIRECELAHRHISIHAPAWGATSCCGFLDVALSFQSTRPRGARPLCGAYVESRTQFQSTRPRGARPEVVVEEDAAIAISIHAPAWGATRRSQPEEAKRHNFNPRARVGRDRRRSAGSGSGKNFNPRARVGRDTKRATLPRRWSRFQSTRPRGARQVRRVGGYA